MRRIGSPFFDDGLKIGREDAFEEHEFAGGGVFKAEGFGVEGMAGYHLKTIFNELLVLGKNCSLEDAVASVGFVVEERMPNMFKMGSNLMGPAGFEFALDEGDISKTFQYFEMGDGMFTMCAIRKYIHDLSVF